MPLLEVPAATTSQAPNQETKTMAKQESIGAPAPLDVDPYWLPNPNGSSSAQSQHPLDDAQIEAQPHCTATAGDNSAETQTVLSEAEAAAEELGKLLSLTICSKIIFICWIQIEFA